LFLKDSSASVALFHIHPTSEPHSARYCTPDCHGRAKTQNPPATRAPDRLPRVTSHVASLPLPGIPFASLRLPLPLRGIPFASPRRPNWGFAGFPSLCSGRAPVDRYSSSLLPTQSSLRIKIALHHLDLFEVSQSEIPR